MGTKTSVGKALEYEIARCNVERLREEIRMDLKALDAYEAEQGSFSEMVRERYGPETDDAS